MENASSRSPGLRNSISGVKPDSRGNRSLQVLPPASTRASRASSRRSLVGRRVTLPPITAHLVPESLPRVSGVRLQATLPSPLLPHTEPAHKQGWLPGHITWAVTQGPTLSLTPKCCCLVSLDFSLFLFLTKKMFTNVHFHLNIALS